MDSNSNIVKFEPNVPVEVTLQYADGLNIAGRYGPRVLYTLTDGRRMYVDAPVAATIRNSGIEPGMPFQVVKRVSADGKRTRWDVNPVATPAAQLVPRLAQSIDQAQRKPVQRQEATPQMVTRGTGTYGPAPQRQAVPVAMPAPPLKVPANVAFGEIVSFVKSELDARGEQWNDEARQAAVCTLFIESGKQGWLAPWERAK